MKAILISELARIEASIYAATTEAQVDALCATYNIVLTELKAEL